VHGKRDGIGGDAVEGGSGSAEMIVEGEGKSFFDTDAARAEIFIGEGRGDEIRGAFVFLPDADIDGIAHEFAHAAFFEGGRDDQWRAGARDDEGEETFAESPTNAGEIVERGAGAEEQGVEFRVEGRHEFLRMKKPRVELIGSNGLDAIAERLESGERRRRLRGLRERSLGQSEGGNGGGGLQETTAREILGGHGVRGCQERREEAKRRREVGLWAIGICWRGLR